MNIVLIGFMCAGKTKVGRLLSKKTGLPFFDSDEVIENQTKRLVPDIINADGLEAFRSIEKEVIAELSHRDGIIIATGGGVPLDAENMDRLKANGKTIWLRVGTRMVLKRVGDISKRPVIDPKDPLHSIHELLEDRMPFYKKAEHTIDTDRYEPTEVVEKILEIVPGRGK